jgi:uncharacterized protein
MDYVWNGIATPSVERLRIAGDGPVLVDSAVDVGTDRYVYEAILDADWVFQELTVRSRAGGQLDLRRTGEGAWSVNGAPRPDLADAIDIDLAFSPFTNTLPIRRLKLAVAESADIVTAYVSVPELDVVTDPQRYTRVAPDRYLYESRDSDFRAEITVDDDGLVADYPGLFVLTSRTADGE